MKVSFKSAMTLLEGKFDIFHADEMKIDMLKDRYASTHTKNYT